MLFNLNYPSNEMATNPDFPQTPESSGGGGDGGILGALVQVGGALYDSHQNRKTARQNTDKTIAANKSEAELAYQRQIDMWNRQNMYNTPQAQMQRFLQAGLNPHLIYGQGNPGNASTPPEYHPPNLQYRYESGNYGAAVSSLLPTLMAVGTWMQNMRLSEAELKQKSTGTNRTQQMIDYMLEANPKLLTQMDNKNSLFPIQFSTQRVAADIAQTKLFEMEQNFRNMFGEGLFSQMGSAFDTEGKPFKPIDGMKRLKFLQEQSKVSQEASKVSQEASKAKLEEARASWSEFDITNPQAIMQLVLSSVMGLAGSAIKFSAKPGATPKTNVRPTGVKRIHPSRRVRSNNARYRDMNKYD